MTTEVQQEQQTNGADHQVDPDIEQEARSLGWVPETEWKGEPPRSGFKSAEEFVQRGKEVLPIVNKRLTEENTKLKNDLAALKSETTTTISNLERMSKVALANQRKQIEESFGAKKEDAIEQGDKKAFREIDKAEKDALAEFDKAAAEQNDDKGGKDGKDKNDKFEVPAEIKSAVDGWVAANPWMKSDEEMKAVANARHARLLKEKPGLTIAENLTEVREYVKKWFPEKFADDDAGGEPDDPPPRRGSPVEGGSRGSGGNSRSAWSRIPKEARAQADRFIKDDGLFMEKGETVEKDLQKARERYAAKYLEQN